MVTRRTVLAAGGGVVVLGAAGYLGSLAWCNATSVASLPLERLDVALADIREPARIGRAFRDREGAAGVEAALRARPALLEAMALDCPETRRTALRTAFREGFAAGDVVTADRWVVSRAECVVAALRNA